MRQHVTSGKRGLPLTGYDAARYGDALGNDYDALYPEAGLDTEATVAFLAELARSRPERSVLEFGIGTGRLVVLC